MKHELSVGQVAVARDDSAASSSAVVLAGDTTNIKTAYTRHTRLTPRDLKRTPLRLSDGREVRSMQDLKLFEMEKVSPWVHHVVDGWCLIEQFVVSRIELVVAKIISDCYCEQTLDTASVCPPLDRPALLLSIYSRRSVLTVPSQRHPRHYYQYTPVTRSLVCCIDHAQSSHCIMCADGHVGNRLFVHNVRAEAYEERSCDGGRQGLHQSVVDAIRPPLWASGLFTADSMHRVAVTALSLV